jgi:hypothetical protein
MSIISSNKYSSAKKEFSINATDLFGASLSNKNGALILIESKKGIKFGAYFTAKIDFINSEVESYLD